MESTLRHRRESFWQIVLPVVLVALIFIGIVIALYITQGAAGVSVAADYSLALVILPSCMTGLILFAITGGLIFGIAWLVQRIPQYTHTAQRGMNSVYTTVDKFTDQLTGFFIGAAATMGGFVNTMEKWGIFPNGDQPTSGDSTTETGS